MRIICKVLKLSDLLNTFLTKFNRYQETKRVWFKENHQYSIKNDYFVEQWDEEKKQQVIQDLRKCIQSGGSVIGAFFLGDVVGFVNVESGLFGSKKEYVELPYIHVSNEYRHYGIGKNLFMLCCEEARKIGAKKLYIAAHPAEETQRFYKSVGCVFAVEVNEEIYRREPLDIQLECGLGRKGQIPLMPQTHEIRSPKSHRISVLFQTTTFPFLKSIQQTF